MDDLIKRLESYRPISEEWGDREHHTICDEAATALAEARATIARLEKAAETIVPVIHALEAWYAVVREGRTIEPSLIGLSNMIGILSAVCSSSLHRAALSPKPAAPSA